MWNYQFEHSHVLPVVTWQVKCRSTNAFGHTANATSSARSILPVPLPRERSTVDIRGTIYSRSLFFSGLRPGTTTYG
jgi:hypothetical protein